MNKLSKVLLLLIITICLVIPSTVEARGRKKNRNNCCSTVVVDTPDLYHGCVIPCNTCNNVLHYHKVLVEQSCVPEVKKCEVITNCNSVPCCSHLCNHVVKTCQTVVECKPVVTTKPIVVYQAAVVPTKIVPVRVSCCQPRPCCHKTKTVVLPCGKKCDSN